MEIDEMQRRLEGWRSVISDVREKLPPAREQGSANPRRDGGLCGRLGVNRATLRKALSEGPAPAEGEPRQEGRRRHPSGKRERVIAQIGGVLPNPDDACITTIADHDSGVNRVIIEWPR